MGFKLFPIQVEGIWTFSKIINPSIGKVLYNQHLITKKLSHFWHPSIHRIRVGTNALP
jgi:hypothetical protein